MTSSTRDDLRLFKVFVPDLIASRSPDGKMRIEGVASSTVRDHHGDTFSLKALRKMAESADGMTIFMNHSYEVPKDVFGRVEKVRLHKTGDLDPVSKQEIWDLRFGIIVASSNPEAVRNFEMIETDQINLGISVGAMLPEGGFTLDKEAGGRLLIDDVDLVEASMVGIPANPRSFVDYAVKSIVGAYPTLFDSKTQTYSRENPKFAKAFEAFAEKGVDHSAGDEDEDAGDGDVQPPDEAPQPGEESSEEATDDTEVSKGVELEVGDVGEIVDGEARVLAKAGTPEAEQWHHDNMGESLEPLGEHLDVEKGKTHQHPHAHVHGHDHEHGYGETVTKHKHDHAHQHSHDHGGDHDHADEQNDYQHNHPHNGSYEEDHAHESGAVKSEKDLEAIEPTPILQKTKVTVWEDSEGGKVVEVNTGRSKPKADEEDQSVQASLTPDTTGGREDVEGGDSEDNAMLEAARALVAKSEDNASDLLKKVLGQLTAARAEASQLKKERDVALDIAQKAMDGTLQILERVAELPAGRKTAEFGQIKRDFDGLGDIFDEDVLRLMRKRSSRQKGS